MTKCVAVYHREEAANHLPSLPEMRRIRNHTLSNDKQDKADEEDTSELVMTEENIIEL